MSLKQIIVLGYILLQQTCSYNSWHMCFYFPRYIYCTFILVLSEVLVCVQYSIQLFCVASSFRAFPVCCSGIRMVSVVPIITVITFVSTSHCYYCLFLLLFGSY